MCLPQLLRIMVAVINYILIVLLVIFYIYINSPIPVYNKRFRIQTLASLHSEQAHICSTAFHSIHPRLCMLIVPVKCCLFAMHSLTHSQDPASTCNLTQLQQSQCKYIVLPFPLFIFLLSVQYSFSKVSLVLPSILVSPPSLSTISFLGTPT